jgi:hypothetical protein
MEDLGPRLSSPNTRDTIYIACGDLTVTSPNPPRIGNGQPTGFVAGTICWGPVISHLSIDQGFLLDLDRRMCRSRYEISHLPSPPSAKILPIPVANNPHLQHPACLFPCRVALSTVGPSCPPGVLLCVRQFIHIRTQLTQ